jgi:single-strand DNA-binding protein
MNLVVLVGNLTRDVETRFTQSGKQVASFTLAVPRPFQKGQTDFFDCTAWNQTAELVQMYLSKGKKCLVQGRLQIDTYEAQDGTKRKATKIICDRVEFLSPRSQARESDPTAGYLTDIGEEAFGEEVPW